MAGVARLQNMPPMVGFTFERWGRVCLDCAGLLAAMGRRCAGWDGASRTGSASIPAPGAAVNCYGLGVLLNGARWSR